MNSILSLTRIWWLLRQDFIQNKKGLIRASTFLIMGGFLLQLSHQSIEGFEKPINLLSMRLVFSIIFLTIAIKVVGTSFPLLRKKESALTFLTLPVTTLERLVKELVSCTLMLAPVPFLYVLGHYMEMYLVSMFGMQVETFTLQEFFIGWIPESFWSFEFDKKMKIGMIIISYPSVLFSILFLGAATFRKHPIVSSLSFGTLFLAVLILLTMISYWLLNISHYGIPDSGTWFFKEGTNFQVTVHLVVSAFGLLAHVVCLAAAYFNLKDQQG